MAETLDWEAFHRLGGFRSASYRSVSPQPIGSAEIVNDLRAEVDEILSTPIVEEVGKVPMWLLLVPALKQVARAMEEGNARPGRGAFNWRRQAVKRSDMIAGALRHILDAENGLEADPDSKQDPLAHAVARLLILMDARDHGMLVDTRVLKISPRKGSD